MKLIGTDGKEIDVSKDSAAASAAEHEKASVPPAGDPNPGTSPGDTAAIAPPPPPLHGQIDNQGVMTLRIDLAVVSGQHDLMDQFSGFMDRFKAVGLAKMVNQQQRRAEIKAAVQKQAAKGGFRNLMNKIRGGR